MTNSIPTFSIIIPNYNSGPLLNRCVSSVLSQSFTDVQIIIIDGASTDKSLSGISNIQDDRVTVVSESDNGIYDAMNKGINCAAGKWLYFLGSDDILRNHLVLSEVSRKLDDSDILIGSIEYENGLLVHGYFGPKLRFFNKTHHQGAFYSRSLFDKFRYNDNIRIVSDYELNASSFFERKRARIIDDVIAICGSNGVSRKDSISNHFDYFKLRSKHISFVKNAIYLFVGLANYLRRRR